MAPVHSIRRTWHIWSLPGSLLSSRHYCWSSTSWKPSNGKVLSCNVRSYSHKQVFCFPSWGRNRFYSQFNPSQFRHTLDTWTVRGAEKLHIWFPGTYCSVCDSSSGQNRFFFPVDSVKRFDMLQTLTTGGQGKRNVKYLQGQGAV